MGGKGGGNYRNKRKNKGKGKGKEPKNVDGEDADLANEGEPAAKRAKGGDRARNDIWREAGTWELSNEAYEAYYQKQAVCPAEDWPKLMQALRTGLPVAVRINRNRLGAQGLIERLQEMRETCTGDEVREQFAPVHLTWFPREVAWQWPGLERRVVKKDKRMTQLKDYLMERERAGLISRQEAVSMMPPLFLDVKPEHMVLDLCAAPGSKTSQILELMHWTNPGEEPKAPRGMVLANELQWKRANMLAHQVARLGSAAAGVVNIDAQFFPELWQRKETGEVESLRFDRILADVPCSGDGTMRKTPYIWKSWTLKDGLSLHIRQLSILYRGLDLLKIGGKIVYSTCSLNPVEDEAVVAAALHRHQGAIRLCPAPDLPGLKAAGGVDTWFIQDEEKGPQYQCWADVPEAKRSGKGKLMPSMFPPVGEGSAEVLASVKANCRRALPHLMDTGGFFVACFEKVGDLKPTARAKRDERWERKQAEKAKAAAAAGEGEGTQPATGGAEASASAAAAENEASSDDEAPVSKAATEEAGGAAAVPSGPPSGLKRITREYVPIAGTELWSELKEFYGFPDSAALNFVKRSDTVQRIFLISDGLAKLLQCEVKMPTRMVLCGVLALEKATSSHVDACELRLSQQGVGALCQMGLKRHVTASREFLLRLMREKELSYEEVNTAVAAGQVKGWSNIKWKNDQVRPGSLALSLFPEEAGNGASLVVVAEATDGTLELAVNSAVDTATFIEELTCQPTVDQILAAAANATAEDNGEDVNMAGDDAEDDGGEADVSENA